MGSIVGGLFGGDKASAGKKAAAQQAAAAQKGIDTVQGNFDYIKGLLTPYSNVGTNAVAEQGNLIGANGDAAQQAAIDELQNSPIFQTLKDQGETSILQNASATGGLRGGNTQVALSQFSPNLLNQLIQQQFGNLGSLTNTGLGAAGGLASAGTGTANTIAQLFQQQGAAQAGGTIAKGNQSSDLVSGIGKVAGIAAAFGF